MFMRKFKNVIHLARGGLMNSFKRRRIPRKQGRELRETGGRGSS